MKPISLSESALRRRFHVLLAGACASLLCIAVACSLKTSAEDWKDTVEVIAAIIPIAAIPAVLFQDRKKYTRRDAALVLPWAFLLAMIFRMDVIASARLRFPLRDDLFVNADRAMGFNLPAIVSWAASSSTGQMLNWSYYFLGPLLLCALLLPALLGKRDAAETFLAANAIAFLTSFPIFAFLPAVGPWIGYNFRANPSQKAEEMAIYALHGGGSSSTLAGIVVCPSFHVIWAVLSAWALWSIRPLRILTIPVAILAAAATLTTGWHYVSDVLAGLVIAGISQYFAMKFIAQPASADAARREGI